MARSAMGGWDDGGKRDAGTLAFGETRSTRSVVFRRKRGTEGGMGKREEAKVEHLATSRASNTGRQSHPHINFLTRKLTNYQTVKL